MGLLPEIKMDWIGLDCNVSLTTGGRTECRHNGCSCVLCAGIVTLAEQLDYESCSQYQLMIAVHEAADLLYTSQLTIDVVNVNDHAPQFSRNEYRIFLSEDCGVGSFVIQLVATDADSCHGD